MKLEPGAYEDPLVAHLHEVEVDEAEGTYTALSYVWGGLSAWDKELQINGIRTPIGANLDKALRRLRSKTAIATIWADAVCINQSDQVEREHQVSLMPQIYAKADVVFSWLGEATQHSVTGVEILAYIAGNQPFDDNAPWNRMNAQDVVLGLEDILQRVYFQRVWIVQEAALGRRINMQVGDLSFQWDGATDAWRFLTRIKLLEISPVWQTEPLSRMDLRPVRELLEQSVATRDKEHGITRATTLLDLVHTMRHRQSTDPRDKIYAVIGLASPADAAGFSPEYSETWEGTYERFYNHAHRTALQNPGEVWAGRQ